MIRPDSLGARSLWPLLLLGACAGPAGEPGAPGNDGEPGASGLACWDLDANGQCDVDVEDRNGDQRCDARDCVADDNPGGAGGTGGAGGGGGVEASDEFVGTEVCALCHEADVEEVAMSGHPYALTAVGADNPATRPFDLLTGGVPAPPLGAAWEAMSYVVGGFGWRALYVAADGYLFTGAEGDATQWNFPLPSLGAPGEWVPYRAGEQVAFDCGSCHATGWVPCPPDEEPCVHQGGLPGMSGSFAEPGVQCEACHGPGRDHAASPYVERAFIDRSAEACGRCHKLGEVDRVAAADGFIVAGQQHNEVFAGRKRLMDCVDCHDAHKSAVLPRSEVDQNQGLRSGCLNCHLGYDTNQKNATMMLVKVDCRDCHMPPLVKSAVGDAAALTADERTHLFRINPAADAEQFYSQDGQQWSAPFLTLGHTCVRCHESQFTLEELSAEATGYHQ